MEVFSDMSPEYMISVAAFVLSAIAFSLSLIVASVSQYEGRMQVIISHLLPKSIDDDGKIMSDMKSMLANEKVFHDESCVGERRVLVEKYCKLYKEKKNRDMLFFGFLAFAVLAVIALVIGVYK